MTIDKKTLRFINLTPEDKLALISLARNIAYKGQLDWNNPYVMLWMKESGYDERQKLMVASTVLPFRMLDSVID